MSLLVCAGLEVPIQFDPFDRSDRFQDIPAICVGVTGHVFCIPLLVAPRDPLTRHGSATGHSHMTLVLAASSPRDTGATLLQSRTKVSRVEQSRSKANSTHFFRLCEQELPIF
ncbi:uncharacterized protein ZBAI_06337 [Zygosaccharomyces bailii ISA1307]|nr:uncharacterized protein ZBAI_06337 [Zygosaccharomyces bailii ISA1307]